MAGYDPNQARDEDGRWTSEGKSYDSQRNMWIVERKDASGNKVGIDSVAGSEMEANRILKKYARQREGWIDPADAAEKSARQAAGLEKIDESYVESKLLEKNVFVDDLQRNKDGTFTIRRSFYYTGGENEYTWKDKVSSALPMAEVVGFGEIRKPFKGGALVKNQNHWWVKVQFPGK